MDATPGMAAWLVDAVLIVQRHVLPHVVVAVVVYVIL